MKNLFNIFAIVMLFTTSFAWANDEKDPPKKNADMDIVELASATDFLSTLVAAVEAGDLVDVLKGDGPYTVFAPTDEAFSKLPDGTLETLLAPENKDQLIQILTYHVIPEKITSGDLRDGAKVKTVQGQEVTISLKDGKAMVNNAEVTAADIEATNGVVHVIDSVILPEM
ncbi:fasciclin domain-containing protein [Pleomorphovibrio marinus]|uniref:fasciclin domain-containing protein n=1 Tax=Pleomorphovibrio marinus TaxID=2164132 RepID=UPI000E0AE757|nr:fasciclin domain-containing protein [Pleomorphovibrio marinus]